MLRFVPDFATGEFQNVGVVVLSESTGHLLLRVPEQPGKFAKVAAPDRQLLADCLQQFLASMRNGTVLHAVHPGLMQKAYGDADRQHLDEYARGVRAPLALAGPHRCNASAPADLARMLYETLVKPPVERRPLSRIDYEIRNRLQAVNLFGPSRLHFHASVRTPIGEHHVKLGYRSVKGQLLVSAANFASTQAEAEVTRAYTSADLMNKFMETTRFPARTIGVFRLGERSRFPPELNLLAAGHQTLVDLSADEHYALDDPRGGGGSLSVTPGSGLEPVVQEAFDALYVPDQLRL
jgi:hypothetical protein